MTQRMERLLIADVEATCWGSAEERGYSPQEIIEIGLAAVDLRSLMVVDTGGIYLKPEMSEVSEFCTNLTGLTETDVAGGHSLREACLLLRGVHGSNKMAWASWGNFDRKQFQRECALKMVLYPFTDTHFNLKAWFAATRGLSQQVGMAKALGICGLSLEGRHHCGTDDAANIARIFIHDARLLRGALS